MHYALTNAISDDKINAVRVKKEVLICVIGW